LANINLFESETVEPESGKKGTIVMILFLVAAVAVVAYFTIQKTIEAKDLADKKSELETFINSDDTRAKLDQNVLLKEQIQQASSANKPIENAYIGMMRLNTATSELIESNIMGPINVDAMELKKIDIVNDTISIDVDVLDINALSEYIKILRAERTTVDKNYIDKPNNAEPEPEDQEISKFNELFATQIKSGSPMILPSQTEPTSPESEINLDYEGHIRLVINKDIDNTARKLVGGAS
jgi:hypothetical protein